jgi:hypothetical protein
LRIAQNNMKSSEYKNRLNQLESILLETNFLIQNHDIPIHHFNSEQFPDEISFIFKPIAIDYFNLPEKAVLSSEGEIISVDNYLTRNFPCKKCKDRERGIRSFLQRGRKKLLILHYSGDTGIKGSAYAKKSSKTIFRSIEVENSFKDLISEALDENYLEYFYQEYPACHFNTVSNPEDWQRRSIECDSHVLETIQKEKIKAILVLGSSAILRWNSNFCKTNQGKVMNWTFADQTKIPFLITRSPEALVHSKNKSDSDYNNIIQEVKDHILKLYHQVGKFD